ncbi:MAG: sodium:solute symporter family protein [Kineosporiaceae bacterium]
MTAAEDLRLDVNALDYGILAVYFAVVVAIGLLARRSIATSEDFFLSGRALPAWVTGLAFISANLGALEILGMAANGAKYGLATVHFYWIGAVPAMVFLGLFMMPFYYSSRVHSVPEYMRRRFNAPTHVVNALSFAVAQLLTAGVNLYALALVIRSLLGWPQWVAIVVSAAFVLAYITLGGLSGAVYNEVLQFFVILAGLIPLVVIGLHRTGGWGGLQDKLDDPSFFHTWHGTQAPGWSNPLGDWIGIVFGLGFALSFGYWTTNFAEVQRALSAKDLSAARRTPLIGAIPKVFIPGLVVIPGLIAVAIVPQMRGEDADYNQAIPYLMRELLPNGVLGVALTGLLAAFMAGMAANVSGFNTVLTYDLWRPYVVRNRDDRYYLRVGRLATVAGVLIGIGTAFIAAGFDNIMDYIQSLFSYFNAPLFAVFILALFWKRASPWSGFAGLLAGIAAALVFHEVGPKLGYFYPGGRVLAADQVNAQMVNFYGAIAAVVVAWIVMALVTTVTPPRPREELRGLVWGEPDPDSPDLAEATAVRAWWERPVVVGAVAISLTVVLSVIFR